LWTADGAYCNLNPAGSKSVAIRVDDRDADGNVLVAGRVTPPEQPRQAAVWKVKVGTCAFAPPTVIDAGRALDVRGGQAGWEAVGDDEGGREARPIYWSESGASSELLHGKNGLAYVISGKGHIVGYRERKGHTVPVLWAK
jgi:hypothetical protein